MSQHHNLDVHPIPERVLFINETDIADPTAYYTIRRDHKKEDWNQLELSQEDNVRVYVPLDLNHSAILRRLHYIGIKMGHPTESNEMKYVTEFRRIVTQLEIYDQVWFVREREYPLKPDEHYHSRHARDLVNDILDELEKWEENSSAECFPYDEIDELEEEYGISREHHWK